jgi:hypothetical protein
MRVVHVRISFSNFFGPMFGAQHRDRRRPSIESGSNPEIKARGNLGWSCKTICHGVNGVITNHVAKEISCQKLGASLLK